ncbi:dynein regulatory complex subunit 4 [Caerostris darwini]|uniref:Dynein regulatory complex subunit 4 n=1 Tax=Caerostris darwini TaxID=1538125 RepID=A0AAV4QH56_9ARAC|nr:dynein regulatory complex subunit 4 [Caerostris darwini]
MPPKKDAKKKVEEAPIGYNVAVMSTAELKQYAHSLEKEIETMRGYCSFFQKSEDELADINRKRQSELKQKTESILEKDLEMEKLRLDVENNIKERRHCPKYYEFANEEKVDRQASETASKLEESLRQHQDEQLRMKLDMLDRELELEAETKKIQIARKAATENNNKKLQDMDNHERNLLESSIEAFVATLEKGREINRLAMKTIQGEALEGRRKAEREFRNVCFSYKHKLKDYYKQITKQDLDAIKDLAGKVKKLEATIQSTKLQLQDVQQKNAVLQETKRPQGPKRYVPGPSRISSKLKLAMKREKEKKIERLKKENDALLEKIKETEEETVNLRKHFTQTLYKVRQSAELKTKFLEKKLQALSENKSTTNYQSSVYQK